jgi:N-acyl-D-amino-acid deacylase
MKRKKIDLLIKNGRVFDGTGNPWYRADVGIQGEKISRVGRIKGDDAEKVIDGEDLGVAPGFWDLHTHDDFLFPSKDHPKILRCRLLQGVTTCVGGNCGYSPFPLLKETAETMKAYCTFLTPPGITWKWSNFDEYSNYLNKQGLAVNTAHLVGHGAIRVGVMGFDASPPGKKQMGKMKDLMEETMRQGCFGMSAGLVYPPGMWSSTDELAELATVVAKHGGFYAAHLRGHSEAHLDAVRENIKIAETAGLPSHIHHLGLYKDMWKIPVTLKMIEEARNVKNLDVTFDFFPYSGANTTINAIWPPWALEGGVPELVKRLKDRKMRKKMLKYMESYVAGWPPDWPWNPMTSVGWDNMLLTWVASEKNKALEGKTVDQIAKEQKMTPLDVVADLTIEEMGSAMIIYFGWAATRAEDYRGECMQQMAKDPHGAFESDAILVGGGKPHPSAFGVQVRALGRYAREMGLIPMEEAVRKITSFPAMRLGIKDRGLVREGCYADITVFNPKTVKDRSTYEDPAQPAEGIEYVIVNGKVVVEKGKHHQKVLAGKVLKRMG